MPRVASSRTDLQPATRFLHSQKRLGIRRYACACQVLRFLSLDSVLLEGFYSCSIAPIPPPPRDLLLASEMGSVPRRFRGSSNIFLSVLQTCFPIVSGLSALGRRPPAGLLVGSPEVPLTPKTPV